MAITKNIVDMMGGTIEVQTEQGKGAEFIVRLPDMNGIEVTRQIRALDDPALAGITILAMTANAFDEDRKKALEYGMDGFLSKPIVIEELISTLHDNLLDQVSGVSEKPYR